jgi:uncharacterized protein YqeY
MDALYNESMSVQNDIKDEIKKAMIARDQVRLTTLRGLSAAFTNELVAKKHRPDEELSDDEALAVISRAVKQRKDSIEQFEKGGRPELAASEREELNILETFLPEQMSQTEIEAFVKQKQSELGITDPAKKNQLLGLVMKDLKGKADGTLVKASVDALFA